jgi:hypothetical protein
MKNMQANSQIIIYKDPNGKTQIDVRFDGTDVWLTQDLMASLFDKGRSTIAEHIQNIFEEGELYENSVCREFRRTGSDGKEYQVKHYNLGVIIAVGYRIKSPQGTAFRQWATERLGEYILKGFIVDSDRLKNPDLPFNYFEELERVVSDIRASEKVFYRKITDIYATSVDYDPTNESSILFFKTVQNKVHYAITGNTAAEIVVQRIDEKKDKMGLTYTRGIKPTKEEVLIAKNYLNKDELEQLNNLVEQYLIFAQGQAMRRVPMTMADWIEKLHGFLNINDREILKNAGKISHELMCEIAEQKFEEYRKIEAVKDTDFDEKITAVLEDVKKHKMIKPKKK